MADSGTDSGDDPGPLPPDPDPHGPPCDSRNSTVVWVYVEGLTLSTALNDVPITLEIVPEGGVDFEFSDVKPVTVASITLSPTFGGLGTPITIDLAPAIYPPSFDCRTTAVWDGLYQPPTGPRTGLFQVSYNAEQLCEQSWSQALIHAGDATVTNMPNVGQLQALGVLNGDLTLILPGATLTRSFDFAPETDAAEWVMFEYLGDLPPFLPILGEPASVLQLMTLSTIPPPLEPDPFVLQNAFLFHHAVVVRVQSSAMSSLGYSNIVPGEISAPVSFLVPGSRADGNWVADNLQLETAEGCQVSAYEIAVYAGTGAEDFDVHVELFDFYDTLFDYPGKYHPPPGTAWYCHEELPALIEGTGIPGTAFDFTGLPGGDVSYLSVPLAATLPQKMWLYASFSTDTAGWVLPPNNFWPQVGTKVIENCYGGPHPQHACGICFGNAMPPVPPFPPPAAPWAQVYCRDGETAACGGVTPTVAVDLVSLDENDVEVDRVENLVLRMVVEDDGDPNQVVYHNDLNRPIVLVDTLLDRGSYPGVVLLYMVDGGSALIVSTSD